MYKAATAFVLPTRGEGWGRPIAEAMAMGLPTIATYWSGQTEFMTDANSFKLDKGELTPLGDAPEKFQREGHLFATPNPYVLGKLMKYIINHPHEASKRGQQARVDMVTKYSEPVVGALVNSELERIIATSQN